MTDENIKNQIITVAKQLFADKGYEGTSLREICVKANVNVASVSYYFGGKENLFFSLFGPDFPPNRLISIDFSQNRPELGISYILNDIIKFHIEDPEVSKIFHQEIIMNSQRKSHLQAIVSPLLQRILQYLKDGKNNGVFCFSDLNQAYLFIIGTIMFSTHSGILFPNLELDGSNKFISATKDIIVLILKGLGMNQESILSVLSELNESK